MMLDPYEACEAAGVAREEEMSPCDDCGLYFDPDETWQCWHCGTTTCDDCKETNGWPCRHFVTER